jgi:hypothetical protein
LLGENLGPGPSHKFTPGQKLKIHRGHSRGTAGHFMNDFEEKMEHNIVIIIIFQS